MESLVYQLFHCHVTNLTMGLLLNDAISKLKYLNSTSTAHSNYRDPHCSSKQVIVYLLEWKWSDIAGECERFLS